MKKTRATIEAAVKLRSDELWKALVRQWRAEREANVKQLVNASQLTEYERAVIAGRIQEMDDVLRLSECTQDDLENFGTK